MPDEQKSPIEQALDLVLYAPLGLAITAKDELPQLIAKGRQRLGQQLTMARMIGKFAVSQGQKEAEKAAVQMVEQVGVITERLGALGGTPGQTPAAKRAAASAGQAVAEAASAADRFPVPPTATPNRANGAAPSANGSAPAGHAAATSDPGPDADSLAIPGYDSLSASQVVQRLAGLAPEELEAVGRYEDSNRGRRTILSKVSQLQSDPS